MLFTYHLKYQSVESNVEIIAILVFLKRTSSNSEDKVVKL